MPPPHPPHPPSSLPPTPAPALPHVSAVLAQVAKGAAATGRFGSVQVIGGRVVCTALNSASPAEYRVWHEGGSWWVGLVMADRYLSQSIEQDIVHTGDKLDDLVGEELIDLGLDGLRPKVEHFRDADKLFTFRSRLESATPPITPADHAELAKRLLLLLTAYEACFVHLGDMEAGGEE